jgi:hypothetical protein
MAMRMSVVMAVAMTVAIGNGLRHCMTAWVSFVAMAVIMIVTVSGFRIDRLRETALFTNLRRFGGFIIVLGPTPFSMSNKTFERRFVHMTGQGNS